MTIRTARPNRGQHFRSRIHCLRKVEAIVVEMQDQKSGVKGSVQKLNVTTIPHAVAGESNTQTSNTPEAQVFGTMLVAYGFIYPLQNHKKLVMCNDSSLYRFQVQLNPHLFLEVKVFESQLIKTAIYLAKRNIRKKGMLEPYEQAHYNHLHDWLNHKWDFIVMQAAEQYKAGRDRNKPDRVIFDCQERAYWIVNRPPFKILLVFSAFCNNIFYQQAIMRPRVKSSVSLGALVKYITTYKNHDPFLAPCLPSNPWLTDHDAYWTLNMRRAKGGGRSH
uniref:G protein gamma domain-containing protein n=1 Tax=Kryptolebias marmoratus TaxID=37003 RepID=A0A3Q3BA62_KRYMA